MTIADNLKARGILPWLDVEQIAPGLPWLEALESQIENIKAAAVFIGPNGPGPCQNMELNALIRQFVQRRSPIIPVFLEGLRKSPKLPAFLEHFRVIDFRNPQPDPMEQLVWGITGKRTTGY